MCIVNCELQNRATVLLVEDNKGLNEANRRALQMCGCTVLTAENLAEAREQLTQAQPDVILLDVMLPDGSGFDFCEEMRGKTKAHIIFLTAKTTHEDMVRGLTGGGDNYITKPFHVEEMLVKVDAAIRRRAIDNTPANTFTFGNLTLDIIAGQAFIDGVDLLLTKKQFSLLLIFARHEDELLSAEQLFGAVWKQDLFDYDKTLRKRVSELRGKLEERNYSHTITTVYGKGYRFEKRKHPNVDD